MSESLSISIEGIGLGWQSRRPACAFYWADEAAVVTISQCTDSVHSYRPTHTHTLLENHTTDVHD